MTSTTLFAGKTISVSHANAVGQTESVLVRQLPLRDYEAAAKLLHDEFAFTAFCLTSTDPSSIWTRDRVLALTPESYEEVQHAAREVNEKGFFAFMARRQARQAELEQKQLAYLSTLEPDALQNLIQVGLAKSRSTPGSRPSASSPG